MVDFCRMLGICRMGQGCGEWNLQIVKLYEWYYGMRHTLAFQAEVADGMKMQWSEGIGSG